MKKIFLLLCMLPLWIACEVDDYDTPADPENAILGKWQLVASGDSNKMVKISDGPILEFYPDGTYKSYDPDLTDHNPEYTLVYEVDSGLLYRNTILDDEILPGEFIQKCYLEKNKLQLQYVDGYVIPDYFSETYLYRRIK